MVFVLAWGTNGCGGRSPFEQLLTSDPEGSGGNARGASGGAQNSGGDGGRSNAGGGRWKESDSLGGAADAMEVCGQVATGNVFIGSSSDAAALKGVGRIHGSLLITGDVVDLDDLDCLQEVMGDLHIRETTKLTRLAGLGGLRKVHGALRIGRTCPSFFTECIGNPVLKDTSSLDELELAGKVFVQFNPVLTNLPLSALQSAQEITIHDNPSLTDVRLDALESVGSLQVSRCGNLRELFCRDLSSAGSIDLEEVGLDRESPGQLYLANLRAASTISMQETGALRLDLPRLVTVDVLDVTRNPFLRDLTIPTLTTAESILIQGNRELVQLHFKSLWKASSLHFNSNPRVESLAGFPALLDIDGLSIAANASLTSIDVFSEVRVLRSELELRNNPALTKLVGFKSLAHVGELTISGNASITTLSELTSLRSADSLRISENQSLPMCEAERFRSQVAVTGEVDLDANHGTGSCDEP